MGETQQRPIAPNADSVARETAAVIVAYLRDSKFISGSSVMYDGLCAAIASFIWSRANLAESNLRGALEFYADPHEGIWEPCEDNGEHGLFRFYITGTSHPREIARRALATAEGND